jgi:hypothetical protein
MTGSIVGDKVYGPGSYFFVPAGVTIGALTSARGATGLLFYNHGEPSFVESDSDHPARRAQSVRDHQRLRRSAMEFDEFLPGDGARMLRQDFALRCAYVQDSPSSTA